MLIQNPLLQDQLEFAPYHIFKTAEKTMRIYTEWLSGDAAWAMQVCLLKFQFLNVLLTRQQARLPEGATLLGTVLSSDKTNLSAATGNRTAHPLLISLANVKKNFRNKASNHVFHLLALLPIPRFLHSNKKIRGVLDARLFHQCLDIVLSPLKEAAKIGVMLSDPLGYRRFCFSPLAAYIVDTPESILIAGVAGKTSPLTLAFYKHFGDNFQHEPRTASTTIAQLMAVEQEAHPWDFKPYFAAAEKFRLSGVHRPFWRDFPLSDPSTFLTPEPLHHWHKLFWDHDVKWCINAVGDAEIDFRFSVLHPHTAFRQFKEGISSLKQVTGREHRDVERYILAVIAGAVPSDFLIAIRALLDFRYLAQAPYLDEETCGQVELALSDFHTKKQAIIDAKARRGKKSSLITNWFIPKLELLQSVVSNIRLNGVAIQWSADVTENAHIHVAKKPARSGNNQDYESQTCRYLDRSDKVRQFDLATSIRTTGLDFRALFDTEDSSPLDNTDDDSDSEFDATTISTTSALLKLISPVSALSATSRTIDYFDLASHLQYHSTVPRPFRTYQSSKNVVFHLSRDPSFKRMTIEDAAAKFGLLDFQPALGDYMIRLAGQTGEPFIKMIGGRRYSLQGCILPFTHVEVWNRVRLQSKSYYPPHDPLPAHTINVFPPSTDWPLGHYDSVLVNNDAAEEWPSSGLKGKFLRYFTSPACLT
jgi:hypothetical protein